MKTKQNSVTNCFLKIITSNILQLNTTHSMLNNDLQTFSSTFHETTNAFTITETRYSTIFKFCTIAHLSHLSSEVKYGGGVDCK